MSAPDFLKTVTPKDQLATALEVLREFKRCESNAEYLHRPFVVWTMFEMCEEYLDHLVNGTPLKPDTVAYIEHLKADGKPPEGVSS